MPREDPTASVGARPVSSVSDEETLRGYCYSLLARLLRSAPDRDLLSQLATLQGDDSEFGVALNGLAAAAAAANPTDVSDEYEALFIGVGSGELVPFASYYLTGFLNEKPLALLRQDMARLGIARAEGVKEPEDHIAALCEMMAGLITGAFGAPSDLDAQKAFFEAHISRWAGKFFKDLEAAKSSVFYAPVGTVGRLFVGIEEAAFEMALQGAGARRTH